MRNCPKCQTNKKNEEFYNGVGYCKPCLKKDYLENREGRIADSSARQAEWRKKAIEKLGGSKCVHCGCKEYDLLQINHRDGDGSYDRKVNGMVSGKFWRSIAMETRDISNLEVTCRLCNQRHYVEDILGYKGFSIAYKAPKKINCCWEKLLSTRLVGTILRFSGFFDPYIH